MAESSEQGGSGEKPKNMSGRKGPAMLGDGQPSGTLCAEMHYLNTEGRWPAGSLCSSPPSASCSQFPERELASPYLDCKLLGAGTVFDQDLDNGVLLHGGSLALLQCY
ncbi:unnamed protein product [Lepidochelys kempii]